MTDNVVEGRFPGMGDPDMQNKYTALQDLYGDLLDVIYKYAEEVPVAGAIGVIVLLQDTLISNQRVYIHGDDPE